MTGEINGSSIFKDLPEVYGSLLPDFFQSEVPQESLSTCNNCAMVCRDKNKDITQLAMRPFQEDKKCCTYHPSLPSYLVGGALTESSPEGVKRLKNAITKKIGVTPFGINAPNVYNILYKNQSGGFGNSENLLCPYFLKESGNCSIWKFRESVCSTYFCKYVAGSSGKRFWTDVKKYLQHVEQCLVQYLAKEAGLDYFLRVVPEFKNQNTQLTAQELDGLPPMNYNEMWGTWNGKEEEFYKWSFEKVTKMSRNTFDEICGIRQKVLLKNLEVGRTEMIDIPEYLKVHKDWLPVEGQVSKIIHYKSIDIQFELPSQVLNAFNEGKSKSEVLKKLNDKEGFEIEESLLISLFQYGILEKQ